MSTIKLKFRPSAQQGQQGSLYFQVIHRRFVRQISLGYKLFPQEWNARQENIIVPLTNSPRRLYLASLQRRITLEMERLRKILKNIGSNYGLGTDIDRLLQAHYTHLNSNGLRYFACQLIQNLRDTGHARIAETYQSALNSFLLFYTDADDILFDEINSELMMRYQRYLKDKGLTLNSISFYMRNLRAVYNRAIEKGLCTQQYPFKHVYTGIAKTTKRALPLKTLREIRNLDLRLDPKMDWARDLFLFSFYTRGMSFIDMAYLQKTDLQNGVLTYHRQKTGQQLHIKWEKPMQDIIDKYNTQNSAYLLPIIQMNGINERRQYLSAVHLANEKLKRIGKLLNLPAPLTTYVARHAWASIAKSQNISLSVISEAMGHDSERTTRIYLATLDTSSVDNANKLIMTSLL